MEKFTPYEKLSKRRKRELNSRRRRDWGALNPVTRKPPNPKAYSRKKVRVKQQDADDSGLFADAAAVLRIRYKGILREANTGCSIYEIGKIYK